MDNGITDRQSHPRPSRFPGCERLKYIFYFVGINTGSIVVDPNLDFAGNSCDANFQTTIFPRQMTHGLRTVHQKVNQHLLEQDSVPINPDF